ncbi:MAG: hypothetical protein ACI8SJ_001868, partial [Shewanella sp.]
SYLFHGLKDCIKCKQMIKSGALLLRLFSKRSVT